MMAATNIEAEFFYFVKLFFLDFFFRYIFYLLICDATGLFCLFSLSSQFLSVYLSLGFLAPSPSLPPPLSSCMSPDGVLGARFAAREKHDSQTCGPIMARRQRLAVSMWPFAASPAATENRAGISIKGEWIDPLHPQRKRRIYDDVLAACRDALSPGTKAYSEITWFWLECVFLASIFFFFFFIFRALTSVCPRALEVVVERGWIWGLVFQTRFMKEEARRFRFPLTRALQKCSFFFLINEDGSLKKRRRLPIRQFPLISALAQPHR